MIYRTVYLTPESYDFVRTKIESGRYENANALVNAALRALNQEESKLDATRSACCVAKNDPFRKLWDAAAQPTAIRE
ncbi:MAG: type II toxin-antitoxin system ParD family antitoxin [Terracidiphilus sp.]